MTCDEKNNGTHAPLSKGPFILSANANANATATTNAAFALDCPNGFLIGSFILEANATATKLEVARKAALIASRANFWERSRDLFFPTANQSARIFQQPTRVQGWVGRVVRSPLHDREVVSSIPVSTRNFSEESWLSCEPSSKIGTQHSLGVILSSPAVQGVIPLSHFQMYQM